MQNDEGNTIMPATPSKHARGNRMAGTFPNKGGVRCVLPRSQTFTPLLPSDVRTRRHRIMGDVETETRPVIGRCSHLIPETDRTSAEMADTSLTSLSDDLHDRLSLICRHGASAVSGV